MSISSLVSKIKNCRILSIDPASHSLAWSIIDVNNGSITVVDYGKINLASTPEMSSKFKIIKNELPGVCANYKPNVCVIEQSVFIQNFQSSRIISYIIGFTWGILDDYCDHVMDVNPLTWKSGIGYKNITKKESALIEKEFGKKGLQQRLSNERKKRVRDILDSQIKDFTSEGLDSDITDAIGIGMWYGINHGS